MLIVLRKYSKAKSNQKQVIETEGINSFTSVFKYNGNLAGLSLWRFENMYIYKYVPVIMIGLYSQYKHFLREDITFFFFF